MTDEMTKPEIRTDIERVKETRLLCELLEDKPFELTIETAMEMLEYNTFAGERPVDDRHVQELYDEMANGRFRPEHVRITLCHFGADVYRINGQHTMWARTYMPKGYGCNVRRLVYRVNNLEELKKLYAVFDPAYSARSVNHLTRMLLSNTAATEGLATSAIGHLAVGFKFWFWGDNKEEFRRQGHNEVSAQILKTPDLFKSVADFYSPFMRTPHIGHRQAVIAAMFECWEKKPTVAAEFWKPVCDGLGLTEKTDARYALMVWLQVHNLSSAGWKDKAKKNITSEEMYRICILAWNKWRINEKVNGAFRATNRRFTAK